MTFPADQVERLIRDRVEELADVMGMSMETAQSYLDPSRLAESVAASFEEDRTGEDMLTLPRDVTLSVPVIPRCVAGLAEAINIQVRYEGPQDALERIGNLSGPISALGLLMGAVAESSYLTGRRCRGRWCYG